MGMRMKYQDSFVKCPFYKENTKEDAIVCEGVGDKMVIEHKFLYRSEDKKEQKKQEYMNKFCCDNYRACPVCRMLMLKYGD